MKARKYNGLTGWYKIKSRYLVKALLEINKKNSFSENKIKLYNDLRNMQNNYISEYKENVKKYFGVDEEVNLYFEKEARKETKRVLKRGLQYKLELN